MNKIVREHYPVSQLPEDLRKEFVGLETVTVVGETEDKLTGAAALADAELRYQSRQKKLAAQAPSDFSAFTGRVTVEEAVARIRELRDEWDD